MMTIDTLQTDTTRALRGRDDVLLVSRLQRGDEAAFEELVRSHGGRLLSVARRFLGASEDAQDAVQESFIRAFKAIHTFEERAQLHTWLHRILVNTALMKLRERRRKPELRMLSPTSSPSGLWSTPRS